MSFLDKSYRIRYACRMSERAQIAEKGPGPIRFIQESLTRPFLYWKVYFGEAWRDPRYTQALEEYNTFAQTSRGRAQAISEIADLDVQFAWDLGETLASQFPHGSEERTQAYEQRFAKRDDIYSKRTQDQTELFNAIFERSMQTSDLRRRIAHELTEQHLKDGRRK